MVPPERLLAQAGPGQGLALSVTPAAVYRAPVTPPALLPFSSCRPAEQRALHVCIIGGGGTGAALAYDLALRGLQVTLLEKGELTSGTTGRHHGQLHSGARYAASDPSIARECMEESVRLRSLVPDAVEYNGGLFVELDDDDVAREEGFVAACRAAGIPARPVPVAEALAREPGLAPGLRGAVWVPDGTFDAYRVPLSFFAAARHLGARIQAWNEVIGFERTAGRVEAAIVQDRSGEPSRERRITADWFVSAAGAWGGKIGSLAGVEIPLTPAAGTMVAVRARLCDHVVSRLRPPGDGDIIVPQRGLSIIGSTQRFASDPESLLPGTGDVSFLLRQASAMIPRFPAAPVHAAWCAARPLAGRARDTGDPGFTEGRLLSRDFVVIDHARDGLQGFTTLIGGKATVLRAMAEKAADLVCTSLAVPGRCRTAEYQLPSWRAFHAGAA
jgi:glycerol-3-phosphate dehydrogenase